MGYGPPQVVEAQPRQSLPFGLFSVLQLRESSDPHWANGITWEAMSCTPAEGIDDPNCETEIEKHFDGSVEIGKATPFAVVATDKCGTPGSRAFIEGEENATAKLLAREEAQAELKVWARLAAGATDLNPAGALDPAHALAALEGWMGGTYGSLGVIHADRQVASLFGRRVASTGARLLTRIGTPVSAGAGYPGTAPDGTAPAAGEAWIFASPALFGYRGAVFTSHALDTRKNDHYAVAERQYVVGFDPCGVGAVRVDLTA